MDFVALKEGAARDIALAFGVPPVLVGLPGDATYANAREAGRSARARWSGDEAPLFTRAVCADRIDARQALDPRHWTVDFPRGDGWRAWSPAPIRTASA